MSDHGAASISMLGTYAPIEREKLLEQVKDPLGTFYRFDYATSHLSRMKIKRVDKQQGGKK
jgi:hypothetical protein